MHEHPLIHSERKGKMQLMLQYHTCKVKINLDDLRRLKSSDLIPLVAPSRLDSSDSRQRYQISCDQEKYAKLWPIIQLVYDNVHTAPRNTLHKLGLANLRHLPTSRQHRRELILGFLRCTLRVVLHTRLVFCLETAAYLLDLVVPVRTQAD